MEPGVKQEGRGTSPLPSLTPIGDGRWAAVVRALNLSGRQAEIVAGILNALTDKEIAERTGLRIPTIRTYLERICKRLHVAGRVELVLRVMAVAEDMRCEGCPHQCGQRTC